MNPLNRGTLDALYDRWNRRGYVEPDPLQFLYDYPDIRDREIAGLVASSLAYGRVASILSSVRKALAPLGPAPAAFLRNHKPGHIRRLYSDFRHRFTGGDELADFLLAIRTVTGELGSLHNCFLGGYGEHDETVIPAMTHMVKTLASASPRDEWSLLCDPGRGSAVKRHMLFLRWMVRRDDVDPGGWEGISPSRLIIPLDTHMFSFSRCRNLTTRNSADLKAALEITSAFRHINPEDPVRYDFSITRFGIRNDLCTADLDELLPDGPPAAHLSEK